LGFPANNILVLKSTIGNICRSTNSPANEEHQLLRPMALAGEGEFLTMPDAAF
jgi:hypothetical protein